MVRHHPVCGIYLDGDVFRTGVAVPDAGDCAAHRRAGRKLGVRVGRAGLEQLWNLSGAVSTVEQLGRVCQSWARVGGHRRAAETPNGAHRNLSVLPDICVLYHFRVSNADGTHPLPA